MPLLLENNPIYQKLSTEAVGHSLANWKLEVVIELEGNDVHIRVE